MEEAGGPRNLRCQVKRGSEEGAGAHVPRDRRRESKLTTCQGGVAGGCRWERVLVSGDSWEREPGRWCSGRAAGVQEASEGLCAAGR